MRAEEFSMYDHGGILAARVAQDKRATELAEQGWHVFKANCTNPTERGSYFLFVLTPQEDTDLIRRIEPETPPQVLTHGRRLNIRTAHIGMHVAVETLPEERHYLHAKQGQITGVWAHNGNKHAMVRFDDGFVDYLPVELLRQIPA